MASSDRDLLNALVAREFPRLPPDVVLDLLDEYGRHPWHTERNRVHLAILKLAAGDEDDLLHWITLACREGRTAIAAAEFPLQSRYHPSRWQAAPAEERARVEAQDRAQYDVWLQRPAPIGLLQPR